MGRGTGGQTTGKTYIILLSAVVRVTRGSFVEAEPGMWQVGWLDVKQCWSENQVRPTCCRLNMHSQSAIGCMPLLLLLLVQKLLLREQVLLLLL